MKSEAFGNKIVRSYNKMVYRVYLDVSEPCHGRLSFCVISADDEEWISTRHMDVNPDDIAEYMDQIRHDYDLVAIRGSEFLSKNNVVLER